MGLAKQRQFLQVRKPHVVVLEYNRTRGTVQFRVLAAIAQLETWWLQHARIVSIQSTNIVQTPIKIICTGSVIPNLQHCNTFALANLLRQPVDEDEKRADRCNERKNDSVHGFLPSDRREDVVNL